MDLTVGAIPGYYATMAAEHWYLRRRASREGPSPADYERRDTAVSLTLGLASLITPIVLPRLVQRATQRDGHVRRGLVVTVVGLAATTTVADRVVAWTAPEPVDPAPDPVRDSQLPRAGTETAAPDRRRRLRRAAEGVAAVGGVATVALGGATVAAAWRTWTANERLWHHRILPDRGRGPLAVAMAVLGWDFIYYWNHRLQHEHRFLWAIHVMHHSSERYNLSTALRQPVTDVFGTFVPPGALSLLGIRPALVESARGVNLLYQYWIHTEAIGRLGAAEAVLNTPSHHRVHHGSNRQYLDRNHGSILIVWDRLFGTFEPEDQQVQYGLTKNVKTYNPLRVATHEYAEMLRDVARATTWRDRLSFVLRGPGWAYQRQAERDGARNRPAEAKQAAPLEAVGMVAQSA